jgi:uncharacterized protein (TIGR00730 family)
MRVTVYAGSAAGHHPAFLRHARTFGAELARAEADIVYGGGRVGLMGAVADGALGQGGKVIGVIPEALANAEIAHTGLSELKVVPDMATRKAVMAELGDCFVALPGSMGTLEEIFEVWAGLILGLHRKPVMLVNHEGYWEPLRAMVNHMAVTGFVRSAERRSLVLVHSAADVFEVARGWLPPPPRWAVRGEAVTPGSIELDEITEPEINHA